MLVKDGKRGDGIWEMGEVPCADEEEFWSGVWRGEGDGEEYVVYGCGGAGEARGCCFVVAVLFFF